jgi:hypothetical protein
MKTLKLFRVALGLVILGLSPSVGLCHSEGMVGTPGPLFWLGLRRSETTVGTSGPIRAFRVNAFLRWAIELRNDSDATYTVIYAINNWAGLRVVPPHSTVKAGCVLGREIPSFRFAPKD